MKTSILKLWPWAIWAIGTCFILFQFVLQLSTGVMVERLMQTFSISSFGAGFLAGSYYYIYVLLQTPAGVLIDRFGARKLLSGGALVCSLGCYLFSVTESVYIAQIGRLMMGGGSAFAFVGTLYLIGNWFPVSRFAFMMGLADMVASLGTLAFNYGLARQIERSDWRSAMYGAAIIAATIAILGWLIIRNRPPGEERPVPPEKVPGRALMALKDIRLWCNGLYIGTLFCITTVFTGMWGVPFIVIQKGVSNEIATLVASSLFIGLAITCPAMGWFYPKARKHLNMVLATVAMISASLLSFLIYFPPKSIVVYAAVMAIIGSLSCVYVFNFSFAREIAPKGSETTAMGFTNTLCIITVPIMQPVIGWLLDFSQKWHDVDTEKYTLIDYQYALMVIPISLFFAAFLGLWLKHEHV